MKYIVEKESPIHYYYKIQQKIKEAIVGGEWKLGEFIPSEREISEKFDVSRVTINNN